MTWVCVTKAPVCPMSPTLIIHAGTYKTGTTSLQHFLFTNRATLAAGGLYRPSTGAVDEPANWGHHLLVQELNTKPPRVIWRQLREECEGKDKVVISSELFSNLRRSSKFAPVRKMFEGWRKSIVVYLRRQDHYLESLYNHHVKSVGETRDILEFADVVEHRLNYLAYLSMLSRFFGEDNLIVRPYEPNSLRGDICDDFLFAIDHQMPAKAVRHKKPLNPGLTVEGMALMLKANRKHAKDSGELDLARRNILSRHAAPPHYKHSVLDPESRAALLDKYAKANRKIARQFLSDRETLFIDGDAG